MDQAEFEAAARRDGFDDIGARTVDEAPANAVHQHTFDARGLILEGAFIITVDDLPTTYEPGSVFHVPAGQLHQETVPAGGARYIFSLKHPATVDA